MHPDERYMKMAIEEAYAGINAGEGGPFGAVITRGGDVLAAAHNSVLKDNDPVRHAETKAISEAARRQGDIDLSGCVIYTTTEPCPMCFSAIHWARIDRVIYGTAIRDVKELGFNELVIPALRMKELGASPVEVTGNFMLDECAGLLEYWRGLPGRKVY